MGETGDDVDATGAIGEGKDPARPPKRARSDSAPASAGSSIADRVKDRQRVQAASSPSASQGVPPAPQKKKARTSKASAKPRKSRASTQAQTATAPVQVDSHLPHAVEQVVFFEGYQASIRENESLRLQNQQLQEDLRQKDLQMQLAVERAQREQLQERLAQQQVLVQALLRQKEP
eukprot:m.142757 g.142757  ORF g.142757 m.142757 type:complete len:176 (+) comp10040_c0_seq2:681-1208(+)